MDSLKGQYFVITGANEGIGFEVAKLLCSKGAHVTMACRNADKMQNAIFSIKQEYPNAMILGLVLGLAKLLSVENFVKEYCALLKPLHCLILNAGVNMIPYQLTEDGYEQTFQVNYLGQAYLTCLLLDKLKESSPSRVVVVGSSIYWASEIYTSRDVSLEILSPSQSKYWDIIAYSNTKFCNVLFARKLNRLYAGHGISAHSLHPGNFIPTKLARYSRLQSLIFFLSRPFAGTLESAADITCYVATSDDCPDKPGRQWINGWFGRYSIDAAYDNIADTLWCFTLKCLKDSRGFVL